MGTLYGVSTGAGDPQLMTVKAVRILESCGVIAAPRTKGRDTLALSIARKAADLSGKRIIYLDYAMSRESSVIAENCRRIADMLCNELENADVAVPVLGDISVYSTFSRIASLVEERGFHVEICAGVNSFSAAAAALGMPLCLGSEPLHILPCGCGGFEELLDLGGTKVIMKTGKNAAELMEILQKKGLSRRTSIVENCGLEDQRIYRADDDIPGDVGYFTVFIVKESSDEA